MVKSSTQGHFKGRKANKKCGHKSGAGSPKRALIDAKHKVEAQTKKDPVKRPVDLKNPWNGLNPLVACVFVGVLRDVVNALSIFHDLKNLQGMGGKR